MRGIAVVHSVLMSRRSLREQKAPVVVQRRARQSVLLCWAQGDSRAGGGSAGGAASVPAEMDRAAAGFRVSLNGGLVSAQGGRWHRLFKVFL